MKNLGKNREGDFLFRLRDFIFCEGVFAMRMKHPPCPLRKGDLKKKDERCLHKFHRHVSA